MKKLYSSTSAILRVIFLLITLISHPILAALPQTLRFGTEATYPPFEFVDSAGKIQGFDIDIANALCKQMKVTCTFSNVPWDSLIPSLKLGKFNALIGGMNITDARKKQVDFTDPYYASTANFVGLTNKVLDVTPAGLKNKTVGVQGGTTLQHFLQEMYPAVKIKAYASQQDAFLDLLSARVDVVLGDTLMVMSWLKSNNNADKYQVIGEPISNTKYFGAGYGIAVKTGNAELLAAFNQALSQIKANGDYKKIVQQHFSTDSR